MTAVWDHFINFCRGKTLAAYQWMLLYLHFSISADNAKLGVMADSSEGHTGTQRKLDRLERWAEKNLMKFNKGRLHLQRNGPRHQHMLGESSWKVALQKRT